VAVLSDSVSSNDAIVFLAGTNLGAAGYEYGLARVTRSVLRSGSPRTYASLETDRAPGEYLAQYYGERGGQRRSMNTGSTTQIPAAKSAPRSCT
jgi:hypothetical protein